MAVVGTIRSSPPARRVRSGAGNVSVRYPSRKWGVAIQAESHRVELAALYEYEHDAQVLEFYDQPPSLKLIYGAKHGRHVGVWRTADYFVVRADAIGWEEWKTEAARASCRDGAEPVQARRIRPLDLPTRCAFG